MISKYLNCKRSEFKDFENAVKSCGCQYEMSTTIFDSDKIWVTVIGEESQMRKFCKKWICVEDADGLHSEKKSFWRIIRDKISGS